MPAHHSPFPRFQRRRAGSNRSGWSPVDLGGHEVVARLHLQLRPGPQAAGEGRHALDRLDGALDHDQLAELRLLVTELLTNSIRHADTPGEWITLEVDIYANAVRVVVTDKGRGFDPEPSPQPHVDRPGGWGLCLVDRLSDRWGVDRGNGTAVWFEVDRGDFARAA
jgi:anti-sigma regulatory factor (Ser/Thr protein kinase)